MVPSKTIRFPNIYLIVNVTPTVLVDHLKLCIVTDLCKNFNFPKLSQLFLYLDDLDVWVIQWNSIYKCSKMGVAFLCIQFCIINSRLISGYLPFIGVNEEFLVSNEMYIKYIQFKEMYLLSGSWKGRKYG